MLLNTATSAEHTFLLTFARLADVHRWPVLQPVPTEVTHHPDPDLRHQMAEGKSITCLSLLNMELTSAVGSPMVLRHGRLHLTSLPTATELVLSQDKAHHPQHVTGINLTSIDRKPRPLKVATEELDVAEVDSAVDLEVQADLETANGSMASTFQVHRIHA
jgi:hypothetical protein